MTFPYNLEIDLGYLLALAFLRLCYSQFILSSQPISAGKSRRTVEDLLLVRAEARQATGT
jgi:hypothetical protein